MAMSTTAGPAAIQLSRTARFALLLATVVLVAIVATALALHGAAGHAGAHFPRTGVAGDIIRFGRPQ